MMHEHNHTARDDASIQSARLVTSVARRSSVVPPEMGTTGFVAVTRPTHESWAAAGTSSQVVFEFTQFVM